MTTAAAKRGLAMPGEFAPHERTLMAWPCRLELWGDELEAAKREYAGVANAIAAFERVTMVCASKADVEAAKAALAANVEIIELPLDDSWLRDSGPCFVTGPGWAREGVCFGFNAWGEKFQGWERDDAVAAKLAAHVGDEAIVAPLILEGGSIAVDGAGMLVTTEQCLLHPSRNPSLDREQIATLLCGHLGVHDVVWLGKGLVEDRDTDGHVDLIATFLAPGRLLLQQVPAGDPNHEAMLENAQRARDAGLEVVPFEPLARIEVAGDPVGLSYLNAYVCNGAVVVPLAGVPGVDEAALARMAEVWPGREVVGVPGSTIAFGGGGPHCITQQVPAKVA
jgi:agmatine deiminase